MSYTAPLAEKDPDQLIFSNVHSAAYLDPQPSALVYLNDDFSADAFTRSNPTGSTIGTLTVTGGQGSLQETSGHVNGTVVTDGADVAMPQIMASIDVVSRSGTAGNTYEVVGCGIAKDGNNFVMAEYDSVAHLIRVEVMNAGTSSLLASQSLTLSFPFTLALSIVGTQCTAWVKQSGTWTSYSRVDITSQLNLKTATLTGWKTGFALFTHGDQTATWVFDNLKGGRFGGVGIRDINIVTNQDGTPYVSGSTVYLLATLPDPGGIASCGVLTFDLDTKAIAQVGLIMVNRSGAIQNDLAGHMIREPDGTFHLTMATWGTPQGFGGILEVNYKHEMALNLLSGANVVASMATLALTQTHGGNVGVYDAYLIKSALDGKWYCAYTSTPDTNFSGNPQYTCLDVTSDPDPAAAVWSNVGADSANTGYEGTKIVAVNGAYWITSAGMTKQRLYNFAMTNILPAIAAPSFAQTDTLPWAMIFPWKKNQYMLTFDNTKYSTGVTFTWGKLYLNAASRY